MKKLVNTVVLVGLLTCVAEAGLKSEAQTRRFGDKIVEEFTSGNISESFEIAKEHWPMPAEELDNLSSQTEAQIKQLRPRFGDIVGKEFIRREKLGDSFLRYQYIIKFENHAIRWILIFYRPKGEWVLNQLNWDDKIERLFD
ncbi:MAG: hypothetical protein ACQEQC_08685 [Elusimicrobiota bacterium]